MKVLTLFLFVGLSLSGCITPTPGEKARSACMDSVPEDIRRAAQGEFDLYQGRAQTALSHDRAVTATDMIPSQPQCSPACQDAREEQQRIVSECYEQWRKVHPSLAGEEPIVPGQ
ncbi:MAG: hypothetical protein NPIRA05_03700 [Nitrospirales bacterium]|nr:MAG: hypothetical protein NPIRA05_03700 [Nitrospirales bacterium]